LFHLNVVPFRLDLNILLSVCAELSCAIIEHEERMKDNVTIKSLMSFGIIGYNVLALGEEADFEALNCQPALNLIRSTKLHLSIEPAFLPSAC
jgi:hypothetical protein